MERIDPVRWRWPRWATLVRPVVVTALLVLAAGVVLTDRGSPSARPAACARAAVATRSPVPPDPTAVPAGRVGVPVRLAEPATVAAVRAGDRVDLVAVPGGVLADDARVLALPGRPDPTTDGVLYLAVRPDQARRIFAAAPDARLAVRVRPR